MLETGKKEGMVVVKDVTGTRNNNNGGGKRRISSFF